MKVKFLPASRVVCDGKYHHIFRKDGFLKITICCCNTPPNNDPKYWASLKNKGCRCPVKKGNLQCQFPELHARKHIFEIG
jgi:hypothetical protein